MVFGKITWKDYKVVLYSHVHTYDGSNEHGYIMCDRGDGHPQRYVVWLWIDDPQYGIHTASGFYSDNIEAAVADFLERSHIRIMDTPKLRIVD